MKSERGSEGGGTKYIGKIRDIFSDRKDTD